jgi:hypothetical protein
MKKMLLLALLLFLPAAAQDGQEEFLRFLREEKRGGDAAIWERVITVKAGPEFWQFANGPGQRTVRNLAFTLGRALSALSKRMGTGDADKVYEQGKRDANAPAFLEVVDGWKGKYALNLDFTQFVPAKGKEQIDNLASMGTTIENGSYLKPRGGKLVLNVSYDPQAQAFAGKVSSDGNTYDAVFPVAGRVPNSRFEELFKKGK